MSDVVIQPVGVLHTCYPEKFGVPRQPGLVTAATGEVHLLPEYAREEAVRGLDGFSHIWLITLFHQVKPEQVGLTARPPRLGGNERMGVFATRSPFRPNRLALSVVKLEGVVIDARGVRLRVSGVDAMDGTPVMDIKPYVPYADAVPGAVGGFASDAPSASPVEWGCDPPVAHADRLLIEQTLSYNPQPAYQEDSRRSYKARIGGYDVVWHVEPGGARIDQCSVCGV